MSGPRRPRDVGDALLASLDQADPVPSTGPALIRYAGGRVALQRQLSGMSGPPARADFGGDEQAYQAARTRWRSAARRVQRWSDEGKEGKQTRGRRRVALAAPERARVESAEVDRRWSRMIRRGLRARLTARVRVPSPIARGGGGDTRLREMPAGGPGVLIPAATVAAIMGALDERNEDEAAGRFLDAFWIAYGMPDDTEIVEVVRLKLWPDGDSEPA